MSVLEITLRSVAVMVAYMVLPLVLGQTEHKLMAHMQGRLGPMKAGGFHGWAQLIADGVKFAQKEDITPRSADKPVFRLAPAVSLLSYLLALAAIPFTPSIVAGDLPGSLVFVLAISGIGTVATLMAGFGSGNKYALLGAFRSAAQLVSYEVPLILACASFAMAAGSLSIVHIANAWHPIWLLWQAPGALVLLIAAVAELQRPPFDMPVADSEVVMGTMTEYTGLRFAFFLLSEYAGIVVMSALFASLYLGGWSGPFSDALGGAVGLVWMLIKTSIIALIILWMRMSWPRVRADQLQRLAWFVLVPLALFQLALTAAGVIYTA